MRLDGRQVKFLTGTDEHGQKVEQSARAGRDLAAGIRRPDVRRVPRHDPAARISATTISSAPPSRAIPARCRRCGASWSGAARSISADLPAGIRCATKPFTTRASWSTARRRPAPRSNGSRRKIISSGFRPGRTGCWPITRPIPMRSRRAAAATRSSALSKAGSRICRSRAPASAGASRSRATPSTSSTSGSTR